MKAKFIFTKYGYRKSDVALKDIVPETDEDYDVADAFLIDFYADDGETVCVEAESFDEATWMANHLLGACASPKNILIEWNIDLNALKAFGLTPSYRMAHYIPAPIKMDQVGRKRYKKYYMGVNNGRPFSPDSLIFDYLTFNHFQQA